MLQTLTVAGMRLLGGEAVAAAIDGAAADEIKRNARSAPRYAR